jgi:Tfp pilus assembly protein PilF
MLVAAARGGRVPDRLRQDLDRLLSSAGQAAPPDEVKTRLRQLLAENPAAREVAIAAATEQLRVRRLFLERQYVTLVREHRASDPTNLTDASLVILMLSASRAGESDMSDLWAQELRRRYPQPDVVRWIAEVRAGRS